MFPFFKLRRRNPSTSNRSHSLPPPVTINWRDGKFQLSGLNNQWTFLREPYYLLLNISWHNFCSLMAAIYLVLNILFALAYLAGGEGIENAKPGSFLDAFFFSVQTLSTIGYGAMYPKTLYAHSIVALESFVGLFGVAMMTGLAFARLAQPTARVIFSRVAVIKPYNGTPTLSFRVANQRRNLVSEGEMKLYLALDEISAEGDFMRRLRKLELVQSHTPTFGMTWTLMHPINENSPLQVETLESLIQSKAMLIASFTGIDETVGEPIHTRHFYNAQEILWNRRFVDIVRQNPQGHRYIDFTHFHDVTD